MSTFLSLASAKIANKYDLTLLPCQVYGVEHLLRLFGEYLISHEFDIVVFYGSYSSHKGLLFVPLILVDCSCLLFDVMLLHNFLHEIVKLPQLLSKNELTNVKVSILAYYLTDFFK